MKFAMGAGLIAILILTGVFVHINMSKPLPQVEPTCIQPVDHRPSLAGQWVSNHSPRISEATAYQIAKEAFKYPHPILLLALMEAESEFTPTAVSSKGAVGLGQIMYDIHKKDLAGLGIMKRKDLFDVDKNIKAASFVLEMMLKKNKGDIVDGLHSYLGGKDGKYISRIFKNYVYLSVESEAK
jgi:hypothetical protein